MSDISSEAPPAHSAGAHDMLASLREYRHRFTAAAEAYDGSTERAADLEEVMADYSIFVTDERNLAPFAEISEDRSADASEVAGLVTDLRSQSARCAAVMEKYRALRLLDGRSGSVGYFANVESCIEEEFGAVGPTRDSRVLLIGSGSFPMTLLTIAERTGALHFRCRHRPGGCPPRTPASIPQRFRAIPQRFRSSSASDCLPPWTSTYRSHADLRFHQSPHFSINR